MVYEKLGPALEFVWWVDSKNFIEFSRPLYAKLLPFPLNFYYPGQYEKHAKNLVDSLYNEENNHQTLETGVSQHSDLSTKVFTTSLIFLLSRFTSRQKNASAY